MNQISAGVRYHKDFSENFFTEFDLPVKKFQKRFQEINLTSNFKQDFSYSKLKQVLVFNLFRL